MRVILTLMPWSYGNNDEMEKSFKYRASASIYVNELLNADKLLISFKTTDANTYVDCKNNARSRTVC